MPVKYYSSGMFLRLGFSVAIHTEPEILLVDEILAVGDIAFQLKCMERMREVQARGTTIVVVTHNLHSLDQMAPRTIVLSPRPEGLRRCDRGCARHLPRGDAGRIAQTRSPATTSCRRGTPSSAAPTSTLRLLDSDRCRPRSRSSTGEQMTLRISAEFDRDGRRPAARGSWSRPIGGDGPGVLDPHLPGPRHDASGAYGPGRPLEVDVDLAMRLLAGGYTVSVGVRNAGGDLVLGRDAAADVLRDLGRLGGRRAGRPRSAHPRRRPRLLAAAAASSGSERAEPCASC